jgi:hypothetical protein
MTTTITATVAASGDDLSWHNEGVGSFSITGATILVGDSDSANFNRWGLIRVTGLTIPVGATITEAHVTVKATGLTGAIPAMTLQGVLGDNVAAPTTRAIANALSLTTASVAWTPTAWVSTTLYPSPDLKTILQEIVNQGTWTSGDSILLAFTVPRDAFTSANAASFRAYDNTPADAAVLSVTYATAFAGVANAGSDQTGIAPYATVTLTSAGSTGSPTAWRWTPLTVGAPALSSTSVASPTFTAPGTLNGATYTWGLEVGDGSTWSAQDTVTTAVNSHDLFVKKSGVWVPARWKARKSSIWV